MRRMGALLGAALMVVTAVVVLRLVHERADATDAGGRDHRPDIVLVLMDDFSRELLQTMPEALRMKRQGATYDNAFVVDSLCCPSRSALLTGQYPHQTGVHTNGPNDASRPVGGWQAFVKHGDLRKQFSIPLQRSGYTTGFIGKYLNGYDATYGPDGEVVKPPPRVPGWSEWNMILGGGYNGWGFGNTSLDAKGRVRLTMYPKPPLRRPLRRLDKTYATNVASDLALSFIRRHRDDAKPYFLEVATYAPHQAQRSAYPGDSMFPPAFADRAPAGDPAGGNCGAVRCGDLGVKDLPGFNDPRKDNAPTYLHRDGTTSPAPAWRTNRVTMTRGEAVSLLRERARMVQAIDRLLTRVRRAAGPDAYIFLTSDNGYHLGQYRLNGGKSTPYDADVHVPLVVVGPQVTPGHRKQFVSEIDLAPTFEALAGLRPPAYVSGRSFAATLSRPHARGARFAGFEHTWAGAAPGDPDLDLSVGGTNNIVPSNIAVRSRRGLLVRLDLDKRWNHTRYAYELYRYTKRTPWEKRNVFARDHDKPYARQLMRRLRLLDRCRPARCRAATR